MIEVQNLSKHFGSHKAVNGLSFKVAEGETLVLLGTSGCGKTTTLRMINRLIEPTAGHVYVNGVDVLAQPPSVMRRGIGYVIQSSGLFPHYTVAENIAVVPMLLKWPKSKIEERTETLMQKFQLSAQSLHKYPAQLSGGQQQRVGLARALAADPPVLLMDEPFGALDPITRTRIRKEFKQLDELKRKTVIMVTHDVQEAFELGDRIGLMNEGSMVQLSTPLEMLFKPTNNYVKDFLAPNWLTLALQTITISSVWHLLPPATENLRLQLSEKATLWDAMEMMVANNVENSIGVVNSKEQGAMKLLSKDSILSYIDHFKMKA